MPSVSASQYSQEETYIARALSSIEKHSEPNLADLARQFGARYDRLRRRYLGRPSRSTRKPAGKKLTELQEEEILNQISQLDHHHIKRIANQILERDHTDEDPPPIVSDKWPQRFVQRYSEQFKGEIDFQLSIKELATKFLQSASAGDSSPAPPAALASSSMVQSLSIASTSKRTEKVGMTNELQLATSTLPSKQVQRGQTASSSGVELTCSLTAPTQDISDGSALEVASYCSNFEPTAVPYAGE